MRCIPCVNLTHRTNLFFNIQIINLHVRKSVLLSCLMGMDISVGELILRANWCCWMSSLTLAFMFSNKTNTHLHRHNNIFYSNVQMKSKFGANKVMSYTIRSESFGFSSWCLIIQVKSTHLHNAICVISLTGQTIVWSYHLFHWLWSNDVIWRQKLGHRWFRS